MRSQSRTLAPLLLGLSVASGGASALEPVAAGGTATGTAPEEDAGDWKDLRVRPLPQRWEFDAGWPEGWVRTGVASVAEGRLSVGDTRGKIDVACTPILQVGAGEGSGEGSAGMRVRWSRAADILSMDPPTWSVLEVREVGEDGRPLGGEAARLFSTRLAQGFVTEQSVWRPAAGRISGSLARACVKTGGAAAGRTLVEWLELLPTAE